MTGLDCRPVRGRRHGVLATIAAAGFACVVSSQALAQDAPAPAQPPAQPAPAQPPAQPAPTAPAAPAVPASNPFMFSSDAAMLTFYIKGDKAADFEKVMAKLHEALANSDKPERRQQAAGWKLYKASDAGPNGTVLYINFLSPTLKGADYTISKILAEVFPQEVQQLFPLYRDAFAGLARAELCLAQDFSNSAAKTPGACYPGKDKDKSASATVPWGTATVVTRVTEKNDTFARHAWRLTVRNISTQVQTFEAAIEFQDANGFVVDTDREYNLTVGPGQEQTFTGDKLITGATAGSVTQAIVKVRQ